eukprot:TRINITY_DN5638_c0_g1_i1.p1 TRINITY_DN5638_c0_g1~~TRINITY_DN5638_c0_g1_i1.p1  ORF type:complete len:750 (+),score=226.12 TRINITY_DN5638_c0_g1_i1:140-2389(+)
MSDGFFQEGKLGFNAKELEQCELLFDTFDVDKSGTIDLDELRQVMWCLGACLSDEELSQLLSQIDLDQSGEVDREEFLFLIKLYKESCRFNTLYKADVTSAHVANANRTTFLYPDDTRLWVWQVVVLVFTLYFMIVVTYADTQTYDTRAVPIDTMLPSHIVGTAVLVLDCVVGAVTLGGKQHPHSLAGKKVNMKYITSWFWVDLLAAVPLDIALHYSDVSPVATLVLSHLRLVKYIKVPFFFAQSERAVMTGHYVRFFYHQVPMIFTCFWWVTTIHILSCIWLALSQNSDYVTAIYWVFYTITSVGYGDVPVETTEKRVFACFLCIGGLIVNGVLAGILTAKMQRANIASEGNDKMMETLSLMKLFNVPEFLQEEILAFQQHLISHSLSAGVSKVVDKLPASIKDNIDMFIKVNFISEVDFFQRVPENCRITLAASLITTVFSPEEVVVLAGEQCSTMYFVTHGFVDVLGGDGSLVSTLSRGDSFGKDALIGLTRFQFTVKAITYCSLLALPREDIIAAMKIYPDFDQVVRDELFADRDPADNPLVPSSPRSKKKASGGSFTNVVPTAPDGDAPAPPPFSPAAALAKAEKAQEPGNASDKSSNNGLDSRPGSAPASPANPGCDDAAKPPDAAPARSALKCTRVRTYNRTRYIVKRARPSNRLSKKLARHIELYVATMIKTEGRHLIDQVVAFLLLEASAERQRSGMNRDSFATNRSMRLQKSTARDSAGAAGSGATPPLVAVEKADPAV